MGPENFTLQWAQQIMQPFLLTEPRLGHRFTNSWLLDSVSFPPSLPAQKTL